MFGHPPSLFPFLIRGMIVLCVFTCTPALAIAESDDYVIDIELASNGDQLHVVPWVRSTRATRLRYEVVSEKRGPAGQSRTAQSGNVNADPDQSVRLSTLLLRVGPDDRYTITVRLFADHTLVAEKSVTFPDQI